MSGPDYRFSRALKVLLERKELPELSHWFAALLDGQLGDVEATAMLVALRTKGESARDLALAARELRKRMVPFDAGRDDVLDTCGTGGDDAGTFNISSAVAFVVAGAGVPVVKHGNRAVSGTTGSSDALRALELPVDAGPNWARRCFDASLLAFCFAPDYHPALVRLGDLRRRLGVRTIFNCLGPLAHPANAAFQLIGVGRPELLDPMAGALAELGVRRAILVCGEGGFDEVSLWGPTEVREVRLNVVRSLTWTPEDFGVGRATLSDLRVSDAATSAAIIEDVLADRDGPARRIVVVNAAAALYAAGRAGSLLDGVAVAAEALSSGRARNVLERMRAVDPRPQ
ncbi:MAG: anthranilate phosphoribosyltransferase [Gemmataceae bacterium]